MRTSRLKAEGFRGFTNPSPNPQSDAEPQYALEVGTALMRMTSLWVLGHCWVAVHCLKPFALFRCVGESPLKTRRCGLKRLLYC